MKRYRKLILLFVMFCLLFCMSVSVFATNYTGDDVAPGLSGIQPGDSLTLPENTEWATLTAVWGVRVTFIDWDESEIQTEIVAVTDTTPGTTTTPADPTRSGYSFDGWERFDDKSGTAVINGDRTVTGINGPGPIVFIAKYIKNVKTLTVTKNTLDGNNTASFPFEVTLEDTDGNPVALTAGTFAPSGSVSYTVGSDGKITFSLKNNESVIIENIPEGSVASITETAHDGYTTSVMEDSVQISTTDEVENLTLDSDRSITYYNNPGVVLPETGGSGCESIFIIGAVLVTGAAIAAARKRESSQRSI